MELSVHVHNCEINGELHKLRITSQYISRKNILAWNALNCFLDNFCLSWFLHLSPSVNIIVIEYLSPFGKMKVMMSLLNCMSLISERESYSEEQAFGTRSGREGNVSRVEGSLDSGRHFPSDSHPILSKRTEQ